MGQPHYSSAYAAAAPGSSSFPPTPLPVSSSSFLSLPVPDSSDAPDPSVPPIDYPPILSSSPTLPSSTTSPSLQQTSFMYPVLTPPPSISPSNPEMISPHHTPIDTSFSGPGLQDHMPALLAQPDQPLQVKPISSRNHSPDDQNSPVFTYPNLPDPAAPQPLPNQNHPPMVSNPSPFLPCSLPNHSAPPSFSFPSVPPPIQNLPFPNMSSSTTHPTLHVQNLSQAQTAAFPPSSFTHPSSSLPHPPFQPSSCSAVPSGSLPSFQPSMSSPTAHHQNLTSASAPSSYPSVELSAIPQFNPGASYLPEMMLHHHPSLLPQLDPYPAFSSYPLRLCQDPRSSLPIPLRHLYRQHQHGHPHPQGSYLDMSARVGNVYC